MFGRSARDLLQSARMRVLSLSCFPLILGTAILLSCSSGASNTEWVPATLETTAAACVGQRATVPASGAVARAFTPASIQALRTPTSLDFHGGEIP